LGRLNPETPGPGNGNPEDDYSGLRLRYCAVLAPGSVFTRYVQYVVLSVVCVRFAFGFRATVSPAGMLGAAARRKLQYSTGAATGTAILLYLGQRKWAAASRCRDLKRWRTSCHLRSGQKCWLRVALVHGSCTGRQGRRAVTGVRGNPSPWIPRRVGYHLTRNGPCYCTGINGVFISGMKPWASANAVTVHCCEGMGRDPTTSRYFGTSQSWSHGTRLPPPHLPVRGSWTCAYC
jgi:hypothetical protein